MKCFAAHSLTPASSAAQFTAKAGTSASWLPHKPWRSTTYRGAAPEALWAGESRLWDEYKPRISVTIVKLNDCKQIWLTLNIARDKVLSWQTGVVVILLTLQMATLLSKPGGNETTKRNTCLLLQFPQLLQPTMVVQITLEYKVLMKLESQQLWRHSFTNVFFILFLHLCCGIISICQQTRYNYFYTLRQYITLKKYLQTKGMNINKIQWITNTYLPYNI